MAVVLRVETKQRNKTKRCHVTSLVSSSQNTSTVWSGVPVLAVDLVSSEGVVKHQNLVGVLEAWPGVVTVLQLHGGVQQRQVPPNDESVWAVCGGGR